MEPADLWTSRLPKRLADRAPRSERGDKYEILYIDGQQIDRQLNDFMDAMRPPGAFDLDVRLKDLDQEGVWSQLAFPSMGFWSVNITDRELAREVARAWNDWSHEEVMSRQDRIFTPAIVSLADVGDAVKELERDRRDGVPGDLPALRDATGRGVGPRHVGAALGGRRGTQDGPGVPHRDRRGERRLPRSRAARS